MLNGLPPPEHAAKASRLLNILIGRPAVIMPRWPQRNGPRYGHAAPRAMSSEVCGRENAVMSEGIEEVELVEIERRAARAFAVAPTPWVAWLETSGGLGGESFIQLGDE